MASMKNLIKFKMGQLQNKSICLRCIFHSLWNNSNANIMTRRARIQNVGIWIRTYAPATRIHWATVTLTVALHHPDNDLSAPSWRPLASETRSQCSDQKTAQQIDRTKRCSNRSQYFIRSIQVNKSFAPPVVFNESLYWKIDQGGEAVDHRKLKKDEKS